MLDEVLIEVQGAIEVIIRWGGIARRDGDEEEETGVWGREIGYRHHVHVYGHYSLPLQGAVRPLT